MGQTTTLSFFRYKSFSQKVWAFKMMQFAHAPLSRVDGLSFYKLLGSGKGLGFNPWPDWSTYAILQVWEDRKFADEYFKSDLYARYCDNSAEQWVIFLEHITSKGTWSGTNPFVTEGNYKDDQPIAVITRATIKWQELRKFWQYVPTAQTGIAGNPKLVFTKGIGEVPFRQMATFSIWQDLEALNEFAYRRKEHGKAIQLTRQRDWYNEEMFARFKVIGTMGSWQGVDLKKLGLQGAEE